MSSTVYVLKGAKGLYIGVTQNFALRFAQHVAGKCKGSVRCGIPGGVEVMHLWEIPTRLQARKFEVYLHRVQSNETLLYELILDCPLWNSLLDAACKDVKVNLSTLEKSMP